MIKGEDDIILVFSVEKLAMGFTNFGSGEEEVHGMPAKGDNQFWLEEFDLGLEEEV